MNVRELNKDQLEELRWTYYWELVIEGENILYASDITNEMLFEKFDGINFVNDDFTCTAHTVWVSVYRDTIEPHNEDDNVTDILVKAEIAEQYYKEFLDPVYGEDTEWKTPLEFWKCYHDCDDTDWNGKMAFYQYAKEHDAIIEMNPPTQTLKELFELIKEIVNGDCIWWYDEDYIYNHIYDNWTLEEIEQELGKEQAEHIRTYWEEHGLI